MVRTDSLFQGECISRTCRIYIVKFTIMEELSCDCWWGRGFGVEIALLTVYI